MGRSHCGVVRRRAGFVIGLWRRAASSAAVRRLAKAVAAPGCHRANGLEQLPFSVTGVHDDFLQLRIRTIWFGGKGSRSWPGRDDLRDAAAAQRLVVAAFPLRPGGMAVAKPDLRQASADAN